MERISSEETRGSTAHAVSTVEPVATTANALPPAQGMFDPAETRDACGVGFVADIKGRKSHA
ncbi:MAG: hypothetical protein LWW93_13675, partial [Hyphomicrobiales bacterium]|nr:hypothetical protein [Hyphomicrobiales bacterium]